MSLDNIYFVLQFFLSLLIFLFLVVIHILLVLTAVICRNSQALLHLPTHSNSSENLQRFTLSVVTMFQQLCAEVQEAPAICLQIIYGCREHHQAQLNNMRYQGLSH